MFSDAFIGSVDSATGTRKNATLINNSLAGPFGDRHDVYVTPEWNPTDTVMTYKAKAHPSFSRDGNWLVTCNVNTTSWNRDLADADIYNPRFIWLRFDPAAGIAGGAGRGPKGLGNVNVTWDAARLRWEDGRGNARGADGRARSMP